MTTTNTKTLLAGLIPLTSAGVCSAGSFGPFLDTGIARRGGLGWVTPTSIFSPLAMSDGDHDWTPFARPRPGRFFRRTHLLVGGGHSRGCINREDCGLDHGIDLTELTRLMDEVANDLLGDDEPTVHLRSTKDHDASSSTNETAVTNATDSSLKPNTRSPQVLTLRRPKYDWRQTEDGYVLTALTPGLKKDEISVEVVNGASGLFLVLSGETKKEESSDTDGKWQTHSYERFQNRIRIPDGIDRESIEAKYEDGALTVNIKAPKETPENVKRIKIA